MGFDPERQKVFKCNLCDGDPQCVHFCYPGSLDFVDDHAIQYARARRSARKSTITRQADKSATVDKGKSASVL
jgi:Fe-S-cluster-containing hydrogenase component 2